MLFCQNHPKGVDHITVFIQRFRQAKWGVDYYGTDFKGFAKNDLS